jgi:hypothetical protein
MFALISTVLSWLACRIRRRAELELELIALRHQVVVLHRQQRGRVQLRSVDRLVWVWLYRVWPRVPRPDGAGEARPPWSSRMAKAFGSSGVAVPVRAKAGTHH